MGLDMYAYSVPAEVAGEKQVDIRCPENTGKPQKNLAYWRKFNHLHGWMEKLYRTKGGQAEPFNCASVRLDPKDLDLLEYEIKHGNLEHTPGFFFGDSNIYLDDITTTMDFITKAREDIAAGRVVLYDSWW